MAAVFAGALAQGEGRAQPLQDPMRPPDALGTANGSSRAAASTSGLQVVITSPQRQLAVIDGSIVPLGAPVRSATLGSVSDSLAVLKKNGEQRDVLLMHPNINKKPARRERP